jgi:hypothetical protein
MWKEEMKARCKVLSWYVPERTNKTMEYLSQIAFQLKFKSVTFYIDVKRITVCVNLFGFNICFIREAIMNTNLVQGLTFLNTAVSPILIHFHLSSSYGADPRTKKFGLNCLGRMDT